MATLNYTGDGGAVVPSLFNAKAQPVCLYRRLAVADIIAADTDMTTNGYITANDIIQALDVPIGFTVFNCIVQIITACTATVDIEVGLNGGAEGMASFSVDGTAGTYGNTIETDAWAGGIHTFEAADTIDVQFITANCLVGDLELWVLGWALQPSSA